MFSYKMNTDTITKNLSTTLLKTLSIVLFVFFLGICNSWSMQIEEGNTDFNPNPKVWYKIVNKEKLFEQYNNPLGGPFLDANPGKVRLHCVVQSSSNAPMILWRFEKAEEGRYKIINRFHEEKGSPKMIYATGNTSVRLTNGEFGNKVQWTITKASEDKDEITPKFYLIINEDGTLLGRAQNNCINSTNLEKNEENNKFQWMFFKEK